MMGGAQRWLDHTLGSMSSNQILKAYPEPGVEFLNFLFREEIRVFIHGRTDSFRGLSSEIDALLASEHEENLGENTAPTLLTDLRMVHSQNDGNA